MIKAMRMKRRILAAVAVLGAAPFVLNGCQLRPELLSATSQEVDGQEVVEVVVRAADARTIKSRQLYFSVVVGECSGDAVGYPAEAFIGDKPADEFMFVTDGEAVKVIGRVPSSIIDRYQRPCAFLRGGGYFTGKLLSSSIPIAMASGKGANNAFKQTPLRG